MNKALSKLGLSKSSKFHSYETNINTKKIKNIYNMTIVKS